jgi:predicted negative regulator of RcsB-dependent stress response
VDDLQSEKEQIEELRAWWSANGRYVIAGVLIAVGLLVGFNQYKSSKLAAQVAASELYDTLVEHVSDGDLDAALVVADELASDYANTAYAAQSKLAMARLYMDKNRDQDAADALTELVNMRGNRELKLVGRLRLAKVLLYQDKPQEVIDLLSSQDDEAFAGLYAEVLGDAYAALGRIDDAAESYRVALADTTQTVNRGIVQMKLIDLPDAPPAEEAAGTTDVSTDGASAEAKDAATDAPGTEAMDEAVDEAIDAPLEDAGDAGAE